MHQSTTAGRSAHPASPPSKAAAASAAAATTIAERKVVEALGGPEPPLCTHTRQDVSQSVARPARPAGP